MSSGEFVSGSTNPFVLIADRDPATRRMFATVLEEHGWRCDEADDGRDALAKSIALLPRVVVIDTQLPGISGYDLCSLLHADPLTSGISVVLTLNDPLPSIVERARAIGAAAVLRKPCMSRLVQTLEQLRQRSDSLMNRSQSLAERAVTAFTKSAVQKSRSTDIVEFSRTLRTSVKARKNTLKASLWRGDTTAPSTPPPALVCPACDRTLVYQRSHIGGVNERLIEQWDYFVCPAGCGTFEYRARTRRLRKVS